MTGEASAAFLPRARPSETGWRSAGSGCRVRVTPGEERTWGRSAHLSLMALSLQGLTTNSGHVDGDTVGRSPGGGSDGLVWVRSVSQSLSGFGKATTHLLFQRRSRSPTYSALLKVNPFGRQRKPRAREQAPGAQRTGRDKRPQPQRSLWRLGTCPRS